MVAQLDRRVLWRPIPHITVRERVSGDYKEQKLLTFTMEAESFRLFCGICRPLHAPHATQGVQLSEGALVEEVSPTNLAMTLVTHAPTLPGRNVLYKPSQMILLCRSVI